MVELDGAVGVGVGGGVESARRCRLADERCVLRAVESEYVRWFHRHEPGDHQCSSTVTKHIRAPVYLDTCKQHSSRTRLPDRLVEGWLLEVLHRHAASRRQRRHAESRRQEQIRDSMQKLYCSSYDLLLNVITPSMNMLDSVWKHLLKMGM